jgi:hypothetical protein
MLSESGAPKPSPMHVLTKQCCLTSAVSQASFVLFFLSECGTDSRWALGFVHRLVFLEAENTTFRKLGLFSSLGEGRDLPTLLGALERANLNH